MGKWGYPAYAGIDPCFTLSSIFIFRLPRIRGDRPARANHFYRDRGATPHTRGSTLHCKPPVLFRRGYPAYAGIDLGGPVASSGPNGLPRIRGDRPGGSLVPSGFMEATPHTRGSTFISTGLSVDQYGYPAYAGIDLHMLIFPLY